MRFRKSFVQERLGAENAEIGKSAPTEQYRICPHEAIFANVHRGRCLTTLLNVDGMGNDLRLKPRDRGKPTDRHSVRAVNKVPMSNGGMLADD